MMQEEVIRMCKRNVLRRVFGPKRAEVTWSGKNYIMRSFMTCTPQTILADDKIEKNEIGGACSAYEGGERRVQGLMGKSVVKKPLGRPRCRWDNIKMDLQEVKSECMDWIELAQFRDRWRHL
jgi:hypothetical protein